MPSEDFPASSSSAPLVIKRYASRRLYNSETSDYVTLEDIAQFIRAGRDIQIVDLKTGDDLTRQYLLQIIADHESRGENMLPIDVLTDLVRTYATEAGGLMPQFLAASLQAFREGQARMLENMSLVPPLNPLSGLEAMQAQQKAFFQAMAGAFPAMTAMTGLGGQSASAQGGHNQGAQKGDAESQGGQEAQQAQREPEEHPSAELEDIRRQLAELRETLERRR